ncbi:MAG: cell division protein FtsZ [bacterium]
MPLPFEFENEQYNAAKIKVIGVGGGGGNAINRMIETNVQGVEFIAINTDAQVLKTSLTPCKIQIGEKITKGLGAGANPEIGFKAATEDKEIIKEILQNTDLIFITATLGGGTGTGASPVIAEIAKEIGALTIAVVTKPFDFEGKRKANYAEEGIKELKKFVDTLIVIPNQKLLSITQDNHSFVDCLKIADDILKQSVQGISDLITLPGLINLDFADIKAITKEMGNALIGIGISSGEKRAEQAIHQAISNPILEDTSIKGACGILLNITAGENLKIKEIDEIASRIKDLADPNANIIWGTSIDNNMEDNLKVTIIATGFEKKEKEKENEKKVFANPSYKPNKINELKWEHKFEIPAFKRKKEEEIYSEELNSIIPASSNNSYNYSSNTSNEKMTIPSIMKNQKEEFLAKEI